MVMFFVVLIVFVSGIIFKNNCVGSINNRNKLRRNYVFFVSIILILQSGLRNLAVGADTYAYSLIFNEISSFWSWDEIWQNFIRVYVLGQGKDPGYALLQKIFQFFLNDYRFFLISVSILFFYSLGIFIYDNTSTILQVTLAYLLYLALFYEFYSITGIRQTIAGALCLISFRYVKTQQIVKFLLCIGIAFMIHKTALFFIPFYFISQLNPRRIYLPILLIFPFLMIFRNRIVAIIASTSDDSRVTQYFVDQYDGAGTYVFTSLIILVALWGFINLKKLTSDRRNHAAINAISLALSLTPLTWFDPNLMRLVMYYSIFLLIFIPTSIDVARIPRKLRMAVIGFTIIFTSYFAIYKNQNYGFFWQEMKLGAHYQFDKTIKE